MKYAILEDNKIIEFGLSKEIVNNRIGIKDKVIEYIETERLVPNPLFSYAVEVEPVQDKDKKWYQQWKPIFYTVEKIRNNLKDKFSKETREHILKKYPTDKQESDIFDKEYYTTYLTHEKNYSLENIQKIAITAAMKVKNGEFKIEETITDKENYLAFEQIIKAYARTIWLVNCKELLREMNKKIDDVTSIDELQQAYFPIKFPRLSDELTKKGLADILEYKQDTLKFNF